MISNEHPGRAQVTLAAARGGARPRPGPDAGGAIDAAAGPGTLGAPETTAAPRAVTGAARCAGRPRARRLRPAALP
jgi:hypothetical protein